MAAAARLADVSAERHLRAAIVAIAAFLAMGIWLEAMIGLRAEGWVDDPLRRELLRLGHAHGGILGLVNVAIAFALERLATPAAWARRIRAAGLGSALLVGLGFVGGGLWHGPTDPGPLILLVPAGAFLGVTSLAALALVRPEDQAP